MQRCDRLVFGLTLSIAFLLAGCGGGGDGAIPGVVGTVVGPAGGTVAGAGGAVLVIPAGALASDVTIAIEQSATNAPAVPGRLTTVGSTFALTPHGTTFNVPVTLTLPFDPSTLPTGTVPVLLKTNAAGQWEQISSATFAADTVTAQITSFSYAVAVVPPIERSSPKREWGFRSTTGYGETINTPAFGERTGGEVLETFLFGGTFDPLFELDNGETPGIAIGEVFSGASGVSYSAYAEAPSGDPSIPGFRSGGVSYLRQFQSFVKRAPDAKLQVILSTGFLAATDSNGRPTPPECDNIPVEGKSDEEIIRFCFPLLSEVEFKVVAYRGPFGEGNYDYLTSVHGDAQMFGFTGEWRFLALSHADSLTPLWSESNFTLTGLGGTSPRAALNGPLVVEVDLSSIEMCPPDLDAVFCADKAFTLFSFVRAESWNRRGNESGAAAYLRDPLRLEGASWRVIGLEATNNPAPPPPDDAAPVGCASGPDPAAGVLGFGAASYSAVEGAASPREIIVSRSGGTKGAVSVHVSTRDGTAIAGIDYDPPAATVRFGDGDSEPRRVTLDLRPNSVVDGDRTLTLELSEPGGCATLGGLSTSTLTILDDDRPPVTPMLYTIGGTVSGLAGSGLVLHDLINGGTASVANGPFTLSGTVADGASYDVRVATQPSSPAQQCTVTNGAGRITGGPVAAIVVACATPASSGALDASFGTDGRVATDIAFAPGIAGAPVGMALQSDGRIVLVGGLKLLRFNTSGSLDAGFGRGGQVAVPFNGSGFDTAQDVAVQPDGKIVVAGFSNAGGSNDNFALARFNVDGSLDTTFGTGGTTTTDFYGSTDRARRVRIQPDGKIVVAGSATVVAPTGASVSFALARYRPDGTLDTGFAFGSGKAADSAGGAYSAAQGLALQADGRIVLAGRTANDGASDPDIGLVRYWGDGDPLHLPGMRDDTFGGVPTGPGFLHSDLGLATGWEEAFDVVVLADGTIAVAARVPVGGTTGGRNMQFVLGLCGTMACSVGQLTSFSAQSDNPRSMLLQPDGKIVIVGQTASLSANPDMAIARYAASGLARDTSFGTDGKLTLDFFGGIDSAEAVVRQPDGKLVIGGYARLGGTTVFALARLLP